MTPPTPARFTLLFWTCLIGLVPGACTGKPDDTRLLPSSIAIGAPAPAFTGVTVRGVPFDLAELRGRVVLLNVWATWCEPCREELPDLVALQNRLGDRGLRVVGVSVDAARDRVLLNNTVSEYGLTYPVVHDLRNLIGGAYKIVGYPTSFVIDREGLVRWRRDGLIPHGDPELEAVLATTLAEAAP